MFKGVIMERLTERNKDVVIMKNPKLANERLAEFEDFMEEVGAESLDELENCIVDLKQENQAHKDRWQKLKEFIEENSSPIDNLVVSDEETKYIYMSDLLDIMEDLEKEYK